MISKVYGANMGHIWVLSAPDGPHVGPMNLAIRVSNRYWPEWLCYLGVGSLRCRTFIMILLVKKHNYTLILCLIFILTSKSKATSITMGWFKFQNMTLRSNCISIPVIRERVTNTHCGLVALSKSPYDYAFLTTTESCLVCHQPNITLYFEHQFHGPVWRREGKLLLQLFQYHYILAICTTQMLERLRNMSNSEYESDLLSSGYRKGARSSILKKICTTIAQQLLIS